MTESILLRTFALPVALAASLLVTAAPTALAQAARQTVRQADYIVAVVNNELVTNAELEQRIARVREGAKRDGSRLPPDAELRRQVLDSLIEERVLITYARDSGQKVDDNELDRAVQGVAQQNQVTMPQLRERLKQEGMDFMRFRNSLRDQIMVERVREHEVNARIQVTDKEIDDFLASRRNAAAGQVEYDIAQILVTVPEGASVEQVVQRQAKARAAQQRVRDGEDFAAVARQVSEDGNKQNGGDIGMKPADRLPDVFVEKVKNLKPGEVAPELLRTGAGFHLLKLVDRKEGTAAMVTQTHARHILLRVSPQLSAEAAARRLAQYKQQIASGQRRFEDIAREISEDGSAAQGGDLGWTQPGSFVPEFEEAMNALPINGISDPVVSRFGVHLIQVMQRREVKVDPKQLREQARNALREQKFEKAYTDWIKDLRDKAFIEMREPPQ